MSWSHGLVAWKEESTEIAYKMLLCAVNMNTALVCLLFALPCHFNVEHVEWIRLKYGHYLLILKYTSTLNGAGQWVLFFSFPFFLKWKLLKLLKKSSNSKFEMNLFTGWPSSAHTYNIQIQINIDVRLRQSYPIYDNK